MKKKDSSKFLVHFRISAIPEESRDNCFSFLSLAFTSIVEFYFTKRMLSVVDKHCFFLIIAISTVTWASQLALVVKNLPANAGDLGLIPRWERLPGGEHGNPLQYSWLENPHGQRSQWAIVHRVAKSWTQLKQLCMHCYPVTFNNNRIVCEYIFSGFLNLGIVGI